MRSHSIICLGCLRYCSFVTFLRSDIEVIFISLIWENIYPNLSKYSIFVIKSLLRSQKLCIVHFLSDFTQMILLSKSKFHSHTIIKLQSFHYNHKRVFLHISSNSRNAGFLTQYLFTLDVVKSQCNLVFKCFFWYFNLIVLPHISQ